MISEKFFPASIFLKNCSHVSLKQFIHNQKRVIFAPVSMAFLAISKSFLYGQSSIVK